MFPSLSPEQTIEKTIREEWERILASLVSGLKDLQLAEDTFQRCITGRRTGCHVRLLHG